jgi:pimeloyl-ACP methyl ester carboxylesterase
VRYARTKDGVNIAYCAVGQGPALVQMNALPYRHISYQWDSLKPIISTVVQRGWSYVAFDARGLGSSSAAEDLSLDAYVSDLEAVVDELQLDVFEIATVTYSCPIAIAYAAKHPDRVSRMALEMPFARGGEALDSEIGRTVRALRGQSWELYTEASMYLITNRNKEWAEESAALLRAAATPEMARRTWDAVDSFDVSGLLDKVSCPTLVTSRADWSLIPVDESRRVAAGILRAEFMEVADATQWTLQTGIFLGILEPSEVPPGVPGVEQTAATSTAASEPTGGASPQIRYARTEDGVNIAYTTLGRGKPCVWVPGFGQTIEGPSSQRLIERYAEDFLVVRYDRAGLGLSDKHFRDSSLDGRLAELEAVVRDLALDRLILRAMGDGCLTAIAYAATNPDKVEKLILFGAFASYRALQ